MTTTDQVVLMAAYNEWMNAKVYEAAERVPTEDLDHVLDYANTKGVKSQSLIPNET